MEEIIRKIEEATGLSSEKRELIVFDHEGQIIAMPTKSAYLRIAERHPAYAGFASGIVIETNDGKIINQIGSILPNGAKLIGGWAKIYRTDRRIPIIAKVPISEYKSDTEKWQKMPATMIRNTALICALREAFPEITTEYQKAKIEK